MTSKLHLGDPCIHCGAPHDEVAAGECPGADGLAAHHRNANYYLELLKAHEASSVKESARLNKLIASENRAARLLAEGLDLNTISLAESILAVGKYSNGGDERASVIRDAIAWLAGTGVRGNLKIEYFGTKQYDRWYGQRSDHSYGYGPKHGSILFSVGLRDDARHRELTQEERDAAIYYLMNLEKIQGGAA